jgi:hypothetical protein
MKQTHHAYRISYPPIGPEGTRSRPFKGEGSEIEGQYSVCLHAFKRAQETAPLLLVMDGSETVGFCGTVVRASRERPTAPTLWFKVEYVFVRPGRRGSGATHALFPPIVELVHGALESANECPPTCVIHASVGINDEGARFLKKLDNAIRQALPQTIAFRAAISRVPPAA